MDQPRVCVCQRWCGQFRGSSAPPSSAAAVILNQVNKEKKRRKNEIRTKSTETQRERVSEREEE